MENPFEIIFRQLADIQARLVELTHPSHAQRTTSERVLLVEEASQFLGIPKSSLYQKISRGEIPCTRHGKRVMFLESDLINWVRKGQRGGIQ